MDVTWSVDLSLDRGSPVPLYFQLSQQLESAIEHGRLRPGALLGNEIRLAGRLGLSRPTVRQAIQNLVDKGLLVRRRGVGTQVVHPRVRRPSQLSSLWDDLEAAGRRPSTLVRSLAAVPAPPEVATALGLADGAEVLRLERLRLADGEPLALLLTYLPPHGFRPSADELETTGLYRLLRTAGVTPHSARQTIGARAATPEEATALTEPPGAPLLTLTRTAYDTAGRAVEHGTHACRASRYSLDLQLLLRP
ncbi:GntR family transcriptional regulator [Streptomyces sp. DSM 44917]|uniref:GntR family transcriptional regulator n=1 Tax=Streptomyces boetiae TaxID=3075541 RepID=A0ABU2L4N6_9ACTN|nr:GntR family transcriptional regulator [Streptomyces sp. DSM 44917]MDT0306337.1 GntR family transcriptional regulator [Streptomyces sp. DSM 44917]